MWLMIFGVILYYVGLVNHRYIHHTLILGLVTIISGTLCWLFVGYSLSFLEIFNIVSFIALSF